MDIFSCCYHSWSTSSIRLYYQTNYSLQALNISIPVLILISVWTERAGPPCLSDVNSVRSITLFLWSLPSCYPSHLPGISGLIVRRVSLQTSFESILEEREYVKLIFWGRIYFLILAHPECKMWIIQAPNTLELWNKLHFEERKKENKHHV